MELIPFTGNLVRRQWRRSKSGRGYTRLSPTNKRNVKIARFGSNTSTAPRRPWRLRLARKLRLVRAASPLKLWHRFKNAYVKMMLRLANASGTPNGENMFGGKRIPRARDLPMQYTRSEFENRLILEICKSMAASLELGYNK